MKNFQKKYLLKDMMWESDHKFKKIFLCQNYDTGVHYVAKVINVNESIKQEVLNEISNLKFFGKYNCFVRLVETYVESEKTIFEIKHTYIIVMEKMKQSLAEVLDEHESLNKSLNAEKVYNWMKDIINALTKLHDENYAHLDLKPENILLDYDGKMKICDLGHIRYLGEEQTTSVFDTFESTRQMYTPYYISPERATNKIKDINMHLLKSDIWSLGLVFLEMIYSKRIYIVMPRELHCKLEDILYHNKVINLSNNAIVPEIKLLIESMLNREYIRRYDIKKVSNVLIKFDELLDKEKRFRKIKKIPFKFNLDKLIWWHQSDMSGAVKTDPEVEAAYYEILDSNNRSRNEASQKLKDLMVEKLDEKKFEVKATLTHNILANEINKDMALGHECVEYNTLLYPVERVLNTINKCPLMTRWFNYFYYAKEYFFFMGYGNQDGESTDKMIMYVDDDDNSRFDPLCEHMEIKPQTRDQFAWCIHRDNLYMFAGTGYHYYRDIWIYSGTVSKKKKMAISNLLPWKCIEKKAPHFQYGLIEATAGAYSNWIVIAGGNYSDGRYNEEIFIFDVLYNTMKVSNNKIPGRRRPVVHEVYGGVLIAFGFHPNVGTYIDAYLLSVTNDIKWKVPLHQSFGDTGLGFQTHVQRHQLIIYGGQNKPLIIKFELKDVIISSYGKDEQYYKNIQKQTKSDFDREDNFTNQQEKMLTLGPYQGGIIGFIKDNSPERSYIMLVSKGDHKPYILKHF